MIEIRKRGAHALRLLVAGTLLATALAVPTLASTGVVNVNTATVDELILLPGIGESKARAIVERRQKEGAYREVEELLEVKGIGDAALDKIREHVVIEGRTTLR